ncbi:MAG: membrane protein insertase YidC [Pyrinomonadaceae bacterium MAG19_C2-C3]|nr:membrane protein insertase YidC [Pyrinomonadaceae bacterium MAG19_C2-C3]
MEQKRFLLALMLSAAILFAWQFVARQYAPVENSNINQQIESPTPSPTPNVTPLTTETPFTTGNTGDVSQREIVVETPLYKVTLDSKGAVVTSWIIKKNKNNGRQLSSISSTADEFQPLELIPQTINGQPLENSPLQITTNNSNLNDFLKNVNYNVSGTDETSDSIVIDEQSGARKIEFAISTDKGINVTKTLEFSPDTYSVLLSTSLNFGGNSSPDARIVIGPNIGDQGIRDYTFYSVAPEASFSINGEDQRHLASDISSDEKSPGRLQASGALNWASVGDTYFAMVAVPVGDLPQSVEYRTTKYQLNNDAKDERFVVSGYVPVTENSSMLLYVGPKDHTLLVATNERVKQISNRDVDLDAVIDYGWFSDISRPLAIQILAIIGYLYTVFGNYGVAIIAFTVMIYTLFFPLKWRSSKSMKKAQKYAPRMKEIQEKIKSLKPNDSQLKELQMEQLRLMKEGNPLGGCLPLLIQMPFFFALYRAITISVDFRQAGFLWISDLSAGDPIHLLPFLMAGSMLVVQLVTPAPTADPLQRKMMVVIIPIVMLYALWSAPAGLLVYWFVGNIVLFSQQMIINKLLQKSSDAQAVV